MDQVPATVLEWHGLDDHLFIWETIGRFIDSENRPSINSLLDWTIFYRINGLTISLLLDVINGNIMSSGLFVLCTHLYLHYSDTFVPKVNDISHWCHVQDVNYDSVCYILWVSPRRSIILVKIYLLASPLISVIVVQLVYEVSWILQSLLMGAIVSCKCH